MKKFFNKIFSPCLFVDEKKIFLRIYLPSPRKYNQLKYYLLSSEKKSAFEGGEEKIELSDMSSHKYNYSRVI
jgi:hypothetical protein